MTPEQIEEARDVAQGWLDATEGLMEAEWDDLREQASAVIALAAHIQGTDG